MDPRNRTTALAALAAAALFGSEAHALGNAATHFSVFAPPNNSNNGRYSMVIITAQSDGVGGSTHVNLTDDGADGDTDDSASFDLTRGQSRVTYLYQGSVNDDAGGKWDGDLFDIQANAPVTVLLATRSDWEHDWATADNNSGLGQAFYLFAPDGTGSLRDVNAFAYTDNTRLRVLELSTSALTTTGTTALTTNPRVLFETTLQAGEDLMVRHRLGIDVMIPGRTYLVEASAPITVLTGALDDLQNRSQARDGGGFVPSSNGSSTGELFYFTVPHDPGHRNEEELRIVGYDSGTTVTLQGWDSTTSAWATVGTYSLPNAFDHADVVGTNYDLFRLTTNAGHRVSVFEGNWLETGSIGTSDIASYVSSDNGTASGTDFLAYLAPPGYQTSVAGIAGTYSHLFLFARAAGATVYVTDADTGGTYFSQTLTVAPNTAGDVRVTSTQWNAMNAPASGRRPYLRVHSTAPIAVWSNNFNDNWLSYAASAASANPTLAIDASMPSVQCGQRVSFDLVSRNTDSADLSSANLECSLTNGLSFVSATEGGAAVTPTVSTSSAGSSVVFASATLAAGSSRTVHLVAQVQCVTGGLRNGDRIPLRGLVRGTGAGLTDSEPMATAATELVVVDDPSFAAFSSASAYPAGSVAVVRATTSREARATRLELVRATTLGGPESQVGSSQSHLGTWTTGATYEWRDTGVSTGSTYYYRVRAVLDDGAYLYTETLGVTVTDSRAPSPPTVFASAGDNRVSVTFSGGNEDGDLAGYVLERNVDGGAWVRLVSGLVASSLYTDASALNGHTYAYRARSQDTSSNLSDYGNTASAMPTVPASVDSVWTVAFEDRLGTGDNDWDYNDLIVEMHLSERFSGSSVAGYTLLLEPLARGASYDHALRLALPAHGPWTATVERWASAASYGGTPLATVTTTGTDSVDLEVLPDTRAALPPPLGETQSNTRPGAQLVVGSYYRVTIDFADSASNPSASRPAAPFDLYLRLTRPLLGEVHSLTATARPTEEVVRADLDGPAGVAMPLALVFDGTLSRWSAESVPAWRPFANFESAARSSFRLSSTVFDTYSSWLVWSRR